jgi:glyoxylase-like metal-dependent hydrolase (beta-lactamase superfamily II)
MENPMGLKVQVLTVGPLAVNCYLAWDPDTRRGVVVDPGDDPDDIAEAIAAARLTPCAVLLTHGHVDHIRGVGGVAARYHVPVYIHPADRALYLSPANALLPWVSAATGLPEPVAVLPDCGGIDIRVLATPGHTPGSVCLHVPGAGVLLSGDTLFCGGVGRTDLPGGCAADLERAIRTVLYPLAPGTRVYPGHGEPTTIGEERRSNPFVRP